MKLYILTVVVEWGNKERWTKQY